jgi:hypothetical protein
MFVVEAAGQQAVVELAEEFVEQVAWACWFQSPAVRRAPGEARSDESAQIGPTAARRRFLICRCSTTVFLPLAQVMGADPA